ncbi:MFS transporter [soil metagenome]
MYRQTGGQARGKAETIRSLLHRQDGASPFYGWLIVAVGMTVIFSSGPGQSYLFSVFLDPIIEDTGLTRTTISGLYALGTFLSAAMVFVISGLADRKGPRWTLTLIAFLFGIACFTMSVASGAILIAIALASLRGLGQGALPINSTLLIASWFVRKRGRAMAIYGLGGALSTALLPSVSRFLIDNVGWQGAYAIFGIFIWLVLIPLTLLAVRNTPEDMGLHPDGADEPPAGEIRADGTRQTGPSRREVIQTKMFWLLVLPIAVPSLVDTALVFHQADLLAERGLSADIAAAIFIPFAIASAISNVVSGFLVDRFGPHKVFVAAASILTLPPILVQVISTPLSAVGYAMIIGGGSGASMMVSRTVWAHFYGRHGLGGVQGSAMVVTIFSSALGPITLSALRDLFGGYNIPLFIMAGMMATAGLVMALQSSDRESPSVPTAAQPSSSE